MDQIKFTLEVEKGRTGLWFISSPELRGLLVAERSLAEALARVVPIGNELWEVMRESGYETESAQKQRAAYEPIFGRDTAEIRPADSL